MSEAKYHPTAAAEPVSDSTVGRTPKILTPPFTPARTHFLLLVWFNLLLVTVCVSLVVVWHLSETHHGFELSNTNHYALTYGPTAVLICFVAVWRQIDYRTKAAAPWDELRKGSSLASRSLLLDYVSPFQAVVLWKAIRNRHGRVALTILAFVLLKLATLISTGLLVEESVLVQSGSVASTKSVFVPKRTDGNNDTSTFDQSLFYTTYGIVTQGLQKPFGLDDGLAYTTFDVPPGIGHDSSLTVAIDGFVPSFECQLANVSASLGPQNTTDPFPETTYEITSPACWSPAYNSRIYTLNPQKYKCPKRQLSGVSQNILCDPSVFRIENNATAIHKLLLLSDMRYNQALSDGNVTARLSDNVQASSWNTEIASLTAIVCRLSYDMEKVTAVAKSSNLTDSVLISAQSASSKQKLGNFSDSDLDSLFRGAVSASDELFGTRLDGAYALEYPDPIFKLMASISGGTYEALLNASTLARSASRVSTQLAAQIAHQYLRANGTQPLPAAVESQSSRVRVATLSTWLLFGILTTVVAISTSIAMYYRHTPEPELIRGIKEPVLQVQTEASLNMTLIASQEWTEKDLHKDIGSTTALLESHGMVTVLSLSTHVAKSRPSMNESPWWVPITISHPVLACTFALTIVLISLLELLQRLSDAHSGFAELSSVEKTSDIFYTHFVPALAVLSVASLFNCLDFNVLLLSPFHKMRTSTITQEQLAKPLLEQIPLAALLCAARNRYWAAMFSSSAAILGSLMTIIVSGLYVPQTLREPAAVSLTTLDSFQLQWPDSSTNDEGAALISTLTENLGFPDPAGTYYGLAFPNMLMNVSIGQHGNSSITVALPVWRAHLSCEALPNSNITVLPLQTRIQNSVTVNASYALPLGCRLGGPSGNESTIQFIHTFNFPLNQSSTYLGKLLDLHVGPYDSLKGDAQNELNPTFLNDNPLGCPSIGLMYGHIDLSAMTSDASSVVVEVCYQHMQTLQANFTFTDMSFNVDPGNPPQPNESTVQFAALSDNQTVYVSDAANATAFQFRPQAHLDNILAVFNQTNNNPFSKVTDSDPAVDPFFQAVLFGRTPLDLERLRLQREDDHNLVRNGTLAFYRRYMAQALNSNMRSTPADHPSKEARVFVGKALTANVRRRVVQTRTPKLILQGILGFMLLCGIGTMSTIRMQRLLPESTNPCTIWGQLSLWAGSRYGQGLRGKKEFSASMGFEDSSQPASNKHGPVLRLGWWPLPDGTRRYGIDSID